MITDESDKRLLNLLRRDARISIAALARKLYLSRSTVKDRITRLEKRGVIKGYSLILGDDYNRGKVSAHILATLESSKSISMTVIKLKQFPQITKA